MNLDWYTPAPKVVFFKSFKSGDIRVGEEVVMAHVERPREGAYILAGYPDDDGIAINQGRRGAALGPDRIRQLLYKMTPSPFFKSEQHLSDFGNLMMNVPIEERHMRVSASVKEAIHAGHRWIGIGGGHDYGYPDAAGFLLANKQNSKIKPLVINFDAHLDVRPTSDGISSGTPFYRLLTDPEMPEFDFVEVGVQGQCNSPYHWTWARDKGVDIISMEDIMMSGQPQWAYISERLSTYLIQERPTFISIDIDGFASSYAMGCSQSWPTGLVPNEIFPLFNSLYSLLNVQVLGVYEVSPPLDVDDRTVKLASQIIHQYIGPIQ